MMPRNTFTHRIRAQVGATMMEMVVLIALVAVIIPPVMSLISYAGLHHTKNEAWIQCMLYANSRVEAMCAFRFNSDGWQDNLDDFSGSESLNGSYTRITLVTEIEEWGTENMDGYEVSVTVTHHLLEDGFTVRTRFTEYEIP